VKKISLAVLALHLALVPVLADVIPSKYDEKSPAARQAVQQRLEELGASPAAAEARIKVLSPDQVAYFAESPERIQAAGSLYWYEWLIGAGFLAILAILYFTVTD
jgi:hypothetical protein